MIVPLARDMKKDNRLIVTAAIILLVVGAALSSRIEPCVRVEKILLATNTPALRIFPATPGSHPIALLAHGNGGSKEMMFRLGEALANAGLDCYSVDQAGYGESHLLCSRTNVRQYFVEAERAVGQVDVFIGHSMGVGTGEWSVLKAGFRPKLFIGLGRPAKLGGKVPSVLLMAGVFDEFFRPADLRAETNAQVIISPWCEHILEPYDPVLVNAVVKAACDTVGIPIPAVPTAWRWRFAGLVLGIAGALVLMFRLPELHPRLTRVRGLVSPCILLLALGLTLGSWVGVTPQLRRILQQLVLLPVIWLALAGLGKMRLPRWSLAAVTVILALFCLAVAHHLAFPQFENSFFLSYTIFCALGLSTLMVLLGVLVGRIATHGGSSRDGDAAMAVFASYAIGQFMPLFY